MDLFYKQQITIFETKIKVQYNITSYINTRQYPSIMYYMKKKSQLIINQNIYNCFIGTTLLDQKDVKHSCSEELESSQGE